jgi:hypothetical protein
MNRKLLLLFVTAFYFFPLFSSGQKIDSMMKVYAARFPQEKLYLQFDKKAYNPGERIWFKAYVFSGFDPSPFSKNLYTELYDAYGNLILRNTSPFVESTSVGSFDLPSSFEGTRVHVKAYTTWMLNFDTTFVYSRDLRIIGSAQDSAVHLPSSPVSLFFFPEGGDLVGGMENNVAFKAEDGFGQPKKISGILYDQTGKPLFNFTSSHNGMGKFLLVPEKQDVFYAVWKDEKGIEHRTDLPAVHSSGIALRILTLKEKLVFSVARPAESQANQQVVVMAHMNQQMVYRAVVNLKDISMSGGNIPTKELPTGVIQVTVFDMNQMPLAERVCFVNNHEYGFEGKLTVSAKSIQKRGRNVVDIDLMDTSKSNLAIAVTDAEVDGNRPGDNNIITGLLLTGDLHGYVKDPYYYFMNESDSLMQQLDLVMLTHGWRRFKWEDLAQGKVPVIKYPLANYLSLNAEVLGVVSSRIAKDESLNVIFQDKDSATNMLTVPYLNNGKFSISGLIFYDTAKAYYQFNTNRNLSNEAAVIFKNGLYVAPKKLKPFDMTMPVWSPDDSSLIRKSQQVFVEIARIHSQDKKVQNLAAVTVRRRIKSDKEKLDEDYASGLFSGGNATIFDLMNNTGQYGALDIFTYLQGRVAGLQVTMNGPTPSLLWRGSTPAVYLNEMQADAGQIKNINISEIAMVKVFSPGSAGAISNSAGGVIAVYTKKGHDKKADPSIKGLEMARIPGYTATREFYSPDYLTNPEPEADDIRTTLYWNPYILGSSKEKKFSFTFYNSDVTHHIRIILEGIDENGKLIHLEKMID